MELKRQNNRLEEELKAMLEQNIESDRRLLQYTKDVFVAGSSSQPSVRSAPTLTTADDFTSSSQPAVATSVSSETTLTTADDFTGSSQPAVATVCVL